MRMFILCMLSFMLTAIFFATDAETKVFNDAVFPYRVICKSEWVEDRKDDTLFQLLLTTTGKKTRFQIKKYTLDSTYSVENMRWSRLSYSINKELAGKLGTLLFSDTSMAKKLGNLRAFELCAFYTQKNEDKSVVWWGEFSRWTEYRGFGYFVSIISDTTDIKSNYAAYKVMLDSVSIKGDVVTGTNLHALPVIASQKLRLSSGGLLVNDLLGRKTDIRLSGPGALLISQGAKKVVLREMSVR